MFILCHFFGSLDSLLIKCVVTIRRRSFTQVAGSGYTLQQFFFKKKSKLHAFTSKELSYQRPGRKHGAGTACSVAVDVPIERYEAHAPCHSSFLTHLSFL
jgi:hypothetical protein